MCDSTTRGSPPGSRAPWAAGSPSVAAGATPPPDGPGWRGPPARSLSVLRWSCCGAEAAPFGAGGGAATWRRSGSGSGRQHRLLDCSTAAATTSSHHSYHYYYHYYHHPPKTIWPRRGPSRNRGGLSSERRGQSSDRRGPSSNRRGPSRTRGAQLGSEAPGDPSRTRGAQLGSEAAITPHVHPPKIYFQRGCRGKGVFWGVLLRD